MPSAESEQRQGLAASEADAPALLGRRNDNIQERTIMTDTTLGASYQAPEATVPNPALGSPNAEPSVAQPQASSTPAGDAKQAAAGVAGQVKQRLTSAATDRKAGIADRLDEVAESLNKSSEAGPELCAAAARPVHRRLACRGVCGCTLRQDRGG
jgi:hypothetical protein